MSDFVLSLKHIKRTFRQGERTVNVLDGVSLAIKPGEVVALVGPSGSGKTTLLQIAGLLDNAANGEICIGKETISHASDIMRTAARLKHIGFIYQFHHLLPEFTALENVVLPLLIAGVKEKTAQEKARGLLEQLGLASRLHHRPAKLSGGEQQRVAIARALANDPVLLLADEPTGNLDHQTAEQVFCLLMETVRRKQLGALVATHNLELARRMDRTVLLVDGVLKQ